MDKEARVSFVSSSYHGDQVIDQESVNLSVNEGSLYYSDNSFQIERKVIVSAKKTKVETAIPKAAHSIGQNISSFTFDSLSNSSDQPMDMNSGFIPSLDKTLLTSDLEDYQYSDIWYSFCNDVLQSITDNDFFTDDTEEALRCLEDFRQSSFVEFTKKWLFILYNMLARYQSKNVLSKIVLNVRRILSFNVEAIPYYSKHFCVDELFKNASILLSLKLNIPNSTTYTSAFEYQPFDFQYIRNFSQYVQLRSVADRTTFVVKDNFSVLFGLNSLISVIDQIINHISFFNKAKYSSDEFRVVLNDFSNAVQNPLISSSSLYSNVAKLVKGDLSLFETIRNDILHLNTSIIPNSILLNLFNILDLLKWMSLSLTEVTDIQSAYKFDAKYSFDLQEVDYSVINFNDYLLIERNITSGVDDPLLLSCNAALKNLALRDLETLDFAHRWAKYLNFSKVVTPIYNSIRLKMNQLIYNIQQRPVHHQPLPVLIKQVVYYINSILSLLKVDKSESASGWIQYFITIFHQISAYDNKDEEEFSINLVPSINQMVPVIKSFYEGTKTLESVVLSLVTSSLLSSLEKILSHLNQYNKINARFEGVKEHIATARRAAYNFRDEMQSKHIDPYFTPFYSIISSYIMNLIRCEAASLPISESLKTQILDNLTTMRLEMANVSHFSNFGYECFCHLSMARWLLIHLDKSETQTIFSQLFETLSKALNKIVTILRSTANDSKDKGIKEISTRYKSILREQINKIQLFSVKYESQQTNQERKKDVCTIQEFHEQFKELYEYRFNLEIDRLATDAQNAYDGLINLLKPDNERNSIPLTKSFVFTSQNSNKQIKLRSLRKSLSITKLTKLAKLGSATLFKNPAANLHRIQNRQSILIDPNSPIKRKPSGRHITINFSEKISSNSSSRNILSPSMATIDSDMLIPFIPNPPFAGYDIEELQKKVVIKQPPPLAIEKLSSSKKLGHKASSSSIQMSFSSLRLPSMKEATKDIIEIDQTNEEMNEIEKLILSPSKNEEESPPTSLTNSEDQIKKNNVKHVVPNSNPVIPLINDHQPNNEVFDLSEHIPDEPVAKKRQKKKSKSSDKHGNENAHISTAESVPALPTLKIDDESLSSVVSRSSRHSMRKKRASVQVTSPIITSPISSPPSTHNDEVTKTSAEEGTKPKHSKKKSETKLSRTSSIPSLPNLHHQLSKQVSDTDTESESEQMIISRTHRSKTVSDISKKKHKHEKESDKKKKDKKEKKEKHKKKKNPENLDEQSRKLIKKSMKRSRRKSFETGSELACALKSSIRTMRQCTKELKKFNIKYDDYQQIEFIQEWSPRIRELLPSILIGYRINKTEEFVIDATREYEKIRKAFNNVIDQIDDNNFDLLKQSFTYTGTYMSLIILTLSKYAEIPPICDNNELVKTINKWIIYCTEMMRSIQLITDCSDVVAIAACQEFIFSLKNGISTSQVLFEELDGKMKKSILMTSQQSMMKCLTFIKNYLKEIPLEPVVTMKMTTNQIQESINVFEKLINQLIRYQSQEILSEAHLMVKALQQAMADLESPSINNSILDSISLTIRTICDTMEKPMRELSNSVHFTMIKSLYCALITSRLRIAFLEVPKAEPDTKLMDLVSQNEDDFNELAQYIQAQALSIKIFSLIAITQKWVETIHTCILNFADLQNISSILRYSPERYDEVINYLTQVMDAMMFFEDTKKTIIDATSVYTKLSENLQNTIDYAIERPLSEDLDSGYDSSGFKRNKKVPISIFDDTSCIHLTAKKVINELELAKFEKGFITQTYLLPQLLSHSLTINSKDKTTKRELKVFYSNLLLSQMQNLQRQTNLSEKSTRVCYSLIKSITTSISQFPLLSEPQVAEKFVDDYIIDINQISLNVEDKPVAGEFGAIRLQIFLEASKFLGILLEYNAYIFAKCTEPFPLRNLRAQFLIIYKSFKNFPQLDHNRFNNEFNDFKHFIMAEHLTILSLIGEEQKLMQTLLEFCDRLMREKDVGFVKISADSCGKIKEVIDLLNSLKITPRSAEKIPSESVKRGIDVIFEQYATMQHILETEYFIEEEAVKITCNFGHLIVSFVQNSLNIDDRDEICPLIFKLVSIASSLLQKVENQLQHGSTNLEDLEYKSLNIHFEHSLIQIQTRLTFCEQFEATTTVMYESALSIFLRLAKLLFFGEEQLKTYVEGMPIYKELGAFIGKGLHILADLLLVLKSVPVLKLRRILGILEAKRLVYLTQDLFDLTEGLIRDIKDMEKKPMEDPYMTLYFLSKDFQKIIKLALKNVPPKMPNSFTFKRDFNIILTSYSQHFLPPTRLELLDQ